MTRLFATAFLIALLFSGASAQTVDAPLAPVPQRPTNVNNVVAEDDQRGGATIEPLARWAYGYARSVAFAENGVGVTMQGSVLQTLDLSNPNQITVLGELEFPGVISDMDARGNIVTVMLTHFQNTKTGLFVVDVSDPSAPVWIGSVTGLAATSVSIREDYAYVGTYNAVDGPDLSLRVISLVDPSAPEEVGVLETDSFAEDIAFLGDRAYLALNAAGLGVVDISTPEEPTLIGRPVTSYVGAVAIHPNGTLALGERNSRGRGILKLYSLATPDMPAELGQTALINRADPLDAIWVGDEVAVACLFGGLQYFDATDPAAPSLIDNAISTSTAFSVSGTNRLAINGDKLLLADFYSGVHQGSASQRQLTGFMKGAGLALDLVVDDETDIIYSAQAGSGVMALERIAPTDGSPERLEPFARVHSPQWNYTTEVALQLNHLYAADGFAGIWAIDKTTMTTTANVLRDTPIRKVAVTEDGDLLLAIDDSQVVHVLSLADPTTPVEVATITPPAGAADIGGTGPVIWISDVTDTRVRLYDMSDPASPQPLTSISLTGSGFRFNRTNDRLYALGTGLVASILDVSTPSSPVFLGEASSVRSQEALAGDGDVLLLAGLGVASYDTSDPSSPVETAFSSDFGDVISEVETVQTGVVAVAVNHAGIATVATPLPTSTTAGPLAEDLRITASPNPSSGPVAVEVVSGSPEALEVAVFDVLGRRVRTLARGLRIASAETLEWDGRSDAGGLLASGVYVVRAQAGSGRVVTARVTLVR